MNKFEGAFSWDKPIELNMLEWLRSMTREWESIASSHDSKSIREGAKHYASAYRTAGEYLLRQINSRRTAMTGNKNE